MAELDPKVFQIGFNKCGTRTLHYFFSGSGIPSIHWQRGNLAKAMFRNLEAGRSLIEGYSEFTVFTDMEYVPNGGGKPLEAFRLFPQLAREFPDAVFVLNTRDRENWIASRLAHRHGGLMERWKLIYGVKSPEEVIERWREDWDEHHNAVREFFSNDAHRFVLFNVEQDPPEVLVRALPEFALDATKYKARGKTPASPGLTSREVEPQEDAPIARNRSEQRARLSEIEDEALEKAGRDPLSALRQYRRFIDDVATVIDVGVHKGTPTLYDIFPDKSFILVDPQRDCEAFLRPPNTYTFVNKALGSSWGQMMLDAQGSKSSFMERTALTRAEGPSERYAVEVTTLDSLIEELCPVRPLGLKIDTEGFELEVLGGLNRHSADFRFIICETSVRRRFVDGYAFSDLVGAMKSRGFEFFNILNEVKRRPAFYDALFLPSSHPLFG